MLGRLRDVREEALGRLKEVGTREELDEWRFFFASSSDAGYTRPNLSYSGLAVARPGDDLSGTPSDVLDHLDPELLAGAGQTVAHYLMVLSSR